MQIFLAAVSVDYIDESISGCWSGALYAIEGEIPQSAAIITIGNTKAPIEKDSQACLSKDFLQKGIPVEID